MDLDDYLNSSHGQNRKQGYPLILNIIKYTLLIILLLSSFYLLILISVFLFNQDYWIASSIVSSSSSSSSGIGHSLTEFDSTSTSLSKSDERSLDPSHGAQMNIQVDLFQIKSALSLVYLAIGFIAIISQDYYISLFFSFSSLIVFLFSLLGECGPNHRQIQLISYSIIVSLLSVIYSTLLKLNMRTSSPYYYGYLQS